MDNISRFIAEIQANIRNFERNVKKAQAMATALPNEIETEVDADISKFRRGLLQAEALARRFSARDIVKNVVVRVDRARNNLRRFVDDVDRMNDNFQNELMRLAKMISAVGIVLGNVIRGGLLASFSALIPIIASLTSAIMALGNALGVTVGNLLGFVGALGVAGLGAAAYGGLVASVLSRYNDEAFEATESSSAFTRALDSIKSAWSGIVDQNIDRIFMQMGQAIYGAQFALEGLTPFINDVVQSMTGMTNKFKEFMKESPTMLRFYDNMSTKGSTVFDSVINGLGQFGKGLVDMVNAGMPLIENVAGAFEDMGTKFADWSARMAENDGFKAFTDYVNENMPKISSIFGDAFHGIINLFSSFGENTSLVLDGLQDMMERFREWSASIKESDGFQKFIDYIQTNGPTVVSLIGNIVMMVVNFAVAMAPIAQVVLEVVNAIIAWTAELFKTNPIVAQVIGVITTLAGIFMMLVPTILVVTKVLLPFIGMLIRLFTQSALVKGAISLLGAALSFLGGPVSIVIAAITALVAIFVMAYQELEWFRNIVNTAWTFISTFIQERVALIIETFNQFREQGQGIFEALWNTIVTIISEGLAQTYNSIIQWVASVIAAIVTWGIQLASTVTSSLTQFALTIAMKLIEAKNNFVTWIVSTIANIVAFGASIISSIISTMASFVSSIISGTASALNAIVSFIASGISSIVSFGASIVSTIISAMASFVSSIISGTVSALSAISSFVSSAISSIVSFVSSLISNIASGMSSFVSSIASGTSSALSTFASFISSAISSIVSFVSQIVSNITSGMSQFVSAIVSGGANAVSAVVSMGSQIVSSVTGFVGDMVSAGADLIRGLINGIKNMAGAAVDAAKSVVGDAIAGAKNLLGINSPSRVFRSFGEYTMQGLEIGINRMASRAVGAVTDVARDMTNSFAPDLTTTADIDSQIGSIDRNIRHSVQDDIDRGIEINQNANINLNLGNRSYRAFAEDINHENTRVTNLEESYLGGAY
ncbi:phage tail protein [Jeotgalicoccus psychrophilus]|uniref:phage tail protein n=1 Tax=Jeotgalicoccus psychrophilus TaxID=157228 RepID=UPI00040F66F2|nr:hypothetical protein [Jeotgalicoccus psychrophilus]